MTLRAIHPVVATVIACALAVLPARAQTPPVALTHITVVRVDAKDEASALARDQVVIIANGRIAAAGRADAVSIPPRAQVIDASGRFLIPGLTDMHVHTLVEGRPEFCFPLFVAHGVTAVRDMGGSLPFREVQRLRAAIASGEMVGPRITSAPGKMIDGPFATARDTFVTAATPEDARRLVREHKAEGWDFIKAYNLLGADVYAALVDEARRQRLPVEGHVPFSMTALDVARAKQRTIEHAADLLVSISRDEAALRRRSASEGANAANANWARAAVEIDAANTIDETKLRTLASRLAREKTWQCPTLVLKAMSAWSADAEPTSDPALPYIPAALRERWTTTFRQLVLPIGTTEARRVRLDATLKLVGAMHRAGVPILAGTDTPPQPYLVPGRSLHEELALLVRAGLTPLEALRTATVNAATFNGTFHLEGSIARGKRADLVVLEANPLERIENTRGVHAVFLNGRYLSRADLDGLLRR